MSEIPVVKSQYVIVTLADGRRGIFAGPELITTEEMESKQAPRLQAVDFTKPEIRGIPNADSQVEQKPTESPGESPKELGTPA